MNRRRVRVLAGGLVAVAVLVIVAAVVAVPRWLEWLVADVVLVPEHNTRLFTDDDTVILVDANGRVLCPPANESVAGDLGVVGLNRTSQVIWGRYQATRSDPGRDWFILYVDTGRCRVGLSAANVADEIKGSAVTLQADLIHVDRVWRRPSLVGGRRGGP